MQLGDVHAELIAFVEDALALALDEGVEANRELGHAVAQVLEAEVYRRERVGHGRL